MPLIRIDEIAPDVRLGLWQISENLSDFFTSYPSLLSNKQMIDGYRADRRKLEVLATRSLVNAMVGEDIVISHDDNGRPLLSNGFNISISHTCGYVAVIVSRLKKVSVDIEYISERVGRIVSRFLRKDEVAVSLGEQLLCWCAKETVYKLFSMDNLAFDEMRISTVLFNGNKGVVRGENLKRGVAFDIYYRMTDDFMLTYAMT